MGRKLKTSVALDEDLLRWVDEMIKRKIFASRSHAVQYALEHLRREYERGRERGVNERGKT
ncbi:hypothetical protein DRO64_09735 [Candidatus Bathyarchaeota archaeon]|nr:MAG: hypothetical protein DRO64_09735 [Candidatus Bathyarchaeota archaeon]